MRKLRPEGFFEAILPGVSELAPAPSSYRIRFRTEYNEVSRELRHLRFSFSAYGI